MSGLTRREIEAVKEDILSSFHCALPGIVEAFRPETRTADIRPAVRGRHKEALPLLQDVPVFLPAPANLPDCLVGRDFTAGAASLARAA